MEIVIKILQFILSFSLLVFIHEFGHFIFARIFKMRVEKFYLFFDPWFSLWKREYNGTTYGIGWVPFGGYVKIAGMVDESMDTKHLSQAPQPWEFRAKKPWQRLIVMAAGVILNVLLAIIIYIGISHKYGESYIANNDVTNGYVFSDVAKNMGLRNGDVVVTIDGDPVDHYGEITNRILLDDARQISIVRGGEQMVIEIPEDLASEIIKSKEAFASPRIPFVIDGVPEDSPNFAAGLLAGDTLIALNRARVEFTDLWTPRLERLSGANVEVVVARGVDGVATTDTLMVNISADGKLGVYQQGVPRLIPITTRSYTFLESIPAGLRATGYMASNYIKQFKLIFNPKTEAYKQMGGVIAIGNIFPGTWSWLRFWEITAMLSIMLAVLNILPIPGLDGGHIVFTLYEMITGRKANEKFMEWATTIGLVLLFGVILLVNGNDILKLFIK